MGTFRKALQGLLVELQGEGLKPEKRPHPIPERTATRTLEVEDEYETVGEVPEAQPGVKGQKVLKSDTPLQRSSPLPVVDSEGETRDALEPIVKPQGGSRKLKGKKTGKKLPRWVVWGGIGIVSLILIGVILAAALGAFGAGNDEPVSELPISVSEGLLETTQPATETVLASPTFTLVLSPTITNTATNAPTFTPTLGIGSVKPNDIDKAEMVYVPAGGFTMGSEASDAYSDESPEHWVTLDAYWIYKTEVTNAQYAQFLNLNVSGNKVEGGETWLDDDGSDVRIQEIDSIWVPNEGYEDHPVIEVTWYGAQAYCEWAGGSLPTEAQWEKAARGEESLYPYPWGNDNLTCDLAQYYGCSGSTVPVDSFPQGASPYGARNMAGNVWEWVADWYDENYYSSSLTDNPTGPDTDGIYRVLRGGSCYSLGRNLRVSNRYRGNPGNSHGNGGFRCLLLP